MSSIDPPTSVEIAPGSERLMLAPLALALFLAASVFAVSGQHADLWVLLPIAVPICFWVAWNDMAHMKIPNLAVTALAVGFVLVGPFVFAPIEYGIRLAQGLVMLGLGFLFFLARLMGAGDCKFLAAMAPYIAIYDMPVAIRLFAAVLLAAFVTHRLARRVPAIRRAVPQWESFDRADFPMGLALGGFLVLYLSLASL